MTNQIKGNTRIKKPPIWAMLIIDVLAACVFLCVFALFHHVIPKNGSGIGTVITRPSQTSDIIETDNITIDSISAPSESETNQFSDEKVIAENSYTDSGTHIEFSTITTGSGSTIVTYHVADIRIADVERLKTAFANDQFGQSIYERILPMVKRNNAIFAVSGDYYGSSDTGVVIRNGTVYRNNDTNSDICVLYYNGEMKVYSPKEFDINECIENGAWQAWTFGPILVEDGKALKSFNTTSYIERQHPRCGIGYIEPGHYVIIVVDGRRDNWSVGVTIKEFAEIFEDYGVKCAYNLDGGRSAVMVFNGEYYNKPYEGGRSLCDMIYIGEEE